MNMRAVNVAPKVPPEITDAIIHLSQDKKSVLATCSLVCRAWVPASRYLLFRQVSLDPRNIRRFHDLSLSPHFTIARYTHELLVDFCRYCKLNGLEQLKISLLPTFPSVQTLTLYNSRWSDYIVITPETKTKLREKFQTVTTLELAHLKLDSFSFANLVHAFPLTRYLDLTTLYFDTISPASAATTPRDWHLSLQSLSITYCYTPGLLEWLQSKPVPAVHTLFLGPMRYTSNQHEYDSEEQCLASEALISLFAESLENISIDYDINYGSIDASPVVKLCTVLLRYRTLSYTLSAKRINNIVVRLKSPCINKMIVGFYQEISEPEEWKIRELEELDKLLGQPPFLDLRKLEFLVPGWTWTWEVERTIEVQIPMCCSRGILHITPGTRSNFERVQAFFGKKHEHWLDFKRNPSYERINCTEW